MAGIVQNFVEANDVSSSISNVAIACKNVFRQSDLISGTDVDEYSVWKFLEEPLKKQVDGGLRSIVWKTKTGVVKTLDQVQLTFLSSDAKELQLPPLPFNWYSRPFVHLFLVQCEVDEACKIILIRIGWRALQTSAKGKD